MTERRPFSFPFYVNFMHLQQIPMKAKFLILVQAFEACVMHWLTKPLSHTVTVIGQYEYGT